MFKPKLIKNFISMQIYGCHDNEKETLSKSSCQKLLARFENKLA